MSNKSTKLTQVKQSILDALSHAEAEDGLYLRNFWHLHEEDERPKVQASMPEIISALNQLVREGQVSIDYDQLDVVFRLDAQREDAVL